MSQFGLLQVKIPGGRVSVGSEWNSALVNCLSKLGGCLRAKTTFVFPKAVFRRLSSTFSMNLLKV